MSGHFAHTVLVLNELVVHELICPVNTCKCLAKSIENSEIESIGTVDVDCALY